MLIGLFGTGRNGSSLIGRLLDGLEDTYVHPVEEKFLTAFDDIAHHGRVTRMVEQNCTTQQLNRLDEDLACEKLAGYYQMSLDVIMKHFEDTIGLPSVVRKLSLKKILRSQTCSVETFTREYLTGLATLIRPDVTFHHHLFKSIEVPYIAEYEQIFPDMKFIHIVRDPVAVCSSQKRSLMENKRLPASYLGFDWLSCMLDKRWVPHARFIAERRENSRHIVVRYEDLVKNPSGEIGRVATWLDLAPPPRPTDQTLFYNLDKTNWGHNPSKKGIESPTKVVADLQLKNRYDEVLTHREIDLITVKTRGLLAGLGYKSPSDATLVKVIVKYLTLDKWELMHCNTPRKLLNGLIGLIYRRVKLF
jgi:hypothetical protein